MTAVEQDTREVALELPPAGSVETIMAADDTRGVPLEVPEWGVTVKVRGFTRVEALKWSDIDDLTAGNVHLVQCGLVDPKVTEEQAREIVEQKSQVAVVRIVKEVMRLSGLGGPFPVAEPDGNVR